MSGSNLTEGGGGVETPPSAAPGGKSPVLSGLRQFYFILCVHGMHSNGVVITE